MILVGLSSIGLGGYFFYAAWNVQGRPQRTTGTIVDVAARFTGNRGNLGYAPKVTFTTADHQLITFTNPVYSSGFRQKTGETITVYYSPDHPEQARVRMPVDSSAIWPILFGSLFFFLGIKSWQHVKET